MLLACRLQTQTAKTCVSSVAACLLMHAAVVRTLRHYGCDSGSGAVLKLAYSGSI